MQQPVCLSVCRLKPVLARNMECAAADSLHICPSLHPGVCVYCGVVVGKIILFIENNLTSIKFYYINHHYCSSSSSFFTLIINLIIITNITKIIITNT